MSWTAPKTYTVGEVLTAATMNTHVRDNLLTINPEPSLTLPASPMDGDIALIVNSLTAPGYAWRFRYDTGIVGDDKWLFIGGAPASAEVSTSESRNANTYGDCATVHSLTLPAIKGVFEFAYGFVGELNSAENNSQWMSPKYGAAEAADGDAAYINAPFGIASNLLLNMSRRRRFTVAAASQVVTMRYRQGTASAASPVESRWLKIVPVAVRA